MLDEEPLLSPHLLDLAEWIAQYYLAPLGEVLRAMLPLTAEVRRTVYYRLTDLGRDILAGQHGRRSRQGNRPPAFAHASQSSLPKITTWSIAYLQRLASGEPVKVSTLRTATAASLPLLAGMVRKKWIARETAAAERDARRMERFAVLIPDTRLPALTEKQQAILAELAACGGELPLAELRRRELPSSTLQTLVRRGLVRIDERPEAFRLGGLDSGRRPSASTPPQTAALATITAALGAIPSVFALRRHRFRQNRCLSRRHAAGSRPRPLVNFAGSGNRPHAANGRPARSGLRAKGRAAPLRPHAR